MPPNTHVLALTPPAASDSSATLLGIPVEARVIIIEEVYHGIVLRIAPPDDSPDHSPDHEGPLPLALAAVCKTLRAEVFLIFFDRKHSPVFCNDVGACLSSHWLSAGLRFLKNIKSIRIKSGDLRYFAKPSCSTDAVAPSVFPNLIILHADLEYDDVATRNNFKDGHGKPGEEAFYVENMVLFAVTSNHRSLLQFTMNVAMGKYERILYINCCHSGTSEYVGTVRNRRLSAKTTGFGGKGLWEEAWYKRLGLYLTFDAES